MSIGHFLYPQIDGLETDNSLVLNAALRVSLLLKCLMISYDSGCATVQQKKCVTLPVSRTFAKK